MVAVLKEIAFHLQVNCPCVPSRLQTLLSLLTAQAVGTITWAYSEQKHFDDDLFEALAVRGLELLQMPRSQPADGARPAASGAVPRLAAAPGTSHKPAVPRLLHAPQVRASSCSGMLCGQPWDAVVQSTDYLKHRNPQHSLS